MMIVHLSLRRTSVRLPSLTRVFTDVITSNFRGGKSDGNVHAGTTQLVEDKQTNSFEAF